MFFLANRIPEEKIVELRQSVDIVDVVSDYVRLRKQGRNYFGLCPFHGENTPSFSVSQEKQIFHCFGCGVGGNVFSFLMEIDGLTFQDAAAKIAEKGNVQIELYSSEKSLEHQIPTEQIRMIEAHELLAKFYHHLLVHTNEGAHALEYLTNRGFSQESIQKFQIGYSIPSWDFTVHFLEKRGFEKPLMEEAGLLGAREDQSYFDRFRNRIMFPLHDARGKVVGFSARAIDKEDKPKYLNTPETVIFNKSSILYNYHEARSHIRKQGHAILFEGFADVISADAVNVKNGVAVMGTSLTDQHVQLLKRMTNSITICFDSDDAGMEAAYRAGAFLVDQDMTVHIVTLPAGTDPDDYIRTYGGEKFKKDMIESPQTWTAFQLLYYRKGKKLQNEGEKLEYIEKSLKAISKLTNIVERDLYTRQLAEEFSLSLEALTEQRNQYVIKDKRKATHPKKEFSPTNIAPALQRTLSKYAAAERQLLARMLRDEELAYKIMDMLGDTNFHYDEHQAILTYLFGYYEEGNPADPSLFINYLPDKKLRTIVTEIDMLSIHDEYSEEELNDCVRHVLKHPKMLMIKEKIAQLKMAEKNNDIRTAIQLAKEILELKKSVT